MFSTAKISSFVAQTILALLVITGLITTTVLTVSALVDQAVLTVTTARDNYWKAELAQSEAETARTIIEQMKLAQKEDQKAQAEIKRLRDQLENLEKENAKLPDIFGSGIDRDRARLLNNHSLSDRPHPD